MLDTLELVKQLPEMYVSVVHWKAHEEWEIREAISPFGTEIINIHDTNKKIFHNEQEMLIYCDMMKWQIVDSHMLRFIKHNNEQANCTVA